MLKGMNEKEDPFTVAQANFYLGTAAIYCRSVGVGKRYLKRSVDIIRRNNIRFVPIPRDEAYTGQGANTVLSSVEPMELIEERVTLLAQVVSMELLIYLVGQPSLVLTGIEVLKDEEPELPVCLCNIFFCI